MNPTNPFADLTKSELRILRSQTDQKLIALFKAHRQTEAQACSNCYSLTCDHTDPKIPKTQAILFLSQTISTLDSLINHTAQPTEQVTSPTPADQSEPRQVKYQYPPDCTTPEQKKAYRRQARKAASR